MASTTDAQPQVRMIALEQIRHDANVRELASEDVDALAGSIALLGQITPVSVRPDGVLGQITPVSVRPDGEGYLLYLQ